MVIILYLKVHIRLTTSSHCKQFICGSSLCHQRQESTHPGTWTPRRSPEARRELMDRHTVRLPQPLRLPDKDSEPREVN